MPNHISNILLIKNADKSIVEKLKGQEDPMDFSKIKEMPESQKDNWYEWRVNNWGTKWNAYDQDFGDSVQEKYTLAVSLLLSFCHIRFNNEEANSIIDLASSSNIQNIELARLQRNNFSIGEPHNSVFHKGHCYYFQTAWNRPVYAMKELSRQHPDAELYLLYADEDIGSNCGFKKYKNGIESDVFDDFADWNYTNENAVEFACFMHGYDYAEYCDELSEE